MFALSMLASAVFAAENGEAVRNGEFTEIGPPPGNAKGIAGTQWAKNWNCAGAAELKDGKIHLSSGVIYQLLRLPGDGRRYLLKAEIKASAMPGKQGMLNARMSSCIRQNPNTPFSHAMQKKFGPFKLDETVRSYRFEFSTEPYEQGYLYIGESSAVIESVSVMLEPAAAK